MANLAFTRIPCFAVGLLLVVAVSGCFGTPVGVRPIDPERAYRQRAASVLTTSEASNLTRIVLHRYDLTSDFDSDPAAAIAELRHRLEQKENAPAELFALAELSFMHAIELQRASRPPRRNRRGARAPGPRQFERTADMENRMHARVESQKYYLASAVYAFALLFPENEEQRVPLIDPRARIAADLYNLSLAEAFSDKGNVQPRSGAFPLPQGELIVKFDRRDLQWGQRRLTRLLPVTSYDMHGLINNYRRPGVGTALVAKTVPLDEEHDSDDFIAPAAWVGATMFLSFDQPRRRVIEPQIDATLELHTETDAERITIQGRNVPLENAPSVVLAASLEESRFWDSELADFFGKALSIEKENRLFTRQPHHPGLIPVVFVHGTQSSAARWADMVNDLTFDPQLRARYQFLFFSYESGNPIAYSSMLLRRALRKIVSSWDPHGEDPCLQQMVVIGHSQGGLLAKMTAIDSGSAFWDALYSKPFDQVKLPSETRALLEEALFVEPLPFVRRVVFIATPHRGSYLAGPDIVRRLAARLIQLPSTLVELTADLSGLEQFRQPGTGLTRRMATSIDNMSPGHPFIRTFAGIPVADGITVNSIIPVREGESFETGGDGVVKYKSAHIDGVESELIVISSHSTQSNPHTIEEVRRILHLHAKQSQCPAPKRPESDDDESARVPESPSNAPDDRLRPAA
jgi:pimeloyl-ACP methyl ester carboxylesterase